MPRRGSPVCVTVMLGLVWLAPALAQAQGKLDEVLTELYKGSIQQNAQILGTTFPGLIVDGKVVDFEEELAIQLITTVFTVNSFIAGQVSSFPLASSAGGFTWAFDASLGIPYRVSDSFGPVFAERALTVGRKRFNLSVAYQRNTFDTLGGRDIESGEISTYSGYPPDGTTVAGQSVFFEDTLSLRLSTDTLIASGTYGLTDRLDVGAVVPFVHISMDAQLASRTGQNGVLLSSARIGSTSATASGIGDVVARVKYRAFPTETRGLAVGVDWRLPTGDDADLIGTGMQIKFYGAASTQTGRLSPHATFGYTISGDSDVAHTENEPDQFNYAAGTDVIVTPRLTVIADFVGRTLVDSAFPVYRPSSFGSNFQALETDYGNVNLLLGSAGVKYALAARGLVSFSVLFPLNDAGLQDKLSWMGGVEFSF